MIVLRNDRPFPYKNEVISFGATCSRLVDFRQATTSEALERVFRVGDSSRKAVDFDLHTEIGGIAGAVTPIIGKQPPDTHVWMSTGKVSTFIRMQGPLYEGGPIWRVDLARPRMSEEPPNAPAVPAFAGAMEFSFDSPAVNSVEQFASGKISLQFRAEAFNVLNHTNVNTFGSTQFGSSLFGKINSARGSPDHAIGAEADFLEELGAKSGLMTSAIS